VAAAEAAAALTAHGVDLVDEYDGGGQLFGLVEQVADAGRADADVELDEVGAGDGEELDVGLSGDGLGEQGLAGARRADQQHALRNPCAQRDIFLRILEEIDDLLKLLLFLVRAGHVGEGELPLLVAAQIITYHSAMNTTMTMRYGRKLSHHGASQP
jgi:hypothetical protein